MGAQLCHDCSNALVNCVLAFNHPTHVPSLDVLISLALFVSQCINIYGSEPHYMHVMHQCIYILTSFLLVAKHDVYYIKRNCEIPSPPNM